MRRTAYDIIRNLETRIAQLEKQSAREKTLFERASRSDKKKVHEILRDAMLENYTPDRNHQEDFDGASRDGYYAYKFDAFFHVEYKVPLQPICKALSRIFRQEVNRADLQPFLDDFYPEEMNLHGSPDDIQKSGLYDIWDMSTRYSDDLERFLEDRFTKIHTEIEIEDVDGDYLIANAYINVSNEDDNL